MLARNRFRAGAARSDWLSSREELRNSRRSASGVTDPRNRRPDDAKWRVSVSAFGNEAAARVGIPRSAVVDVFAMAQGNDHNQQHVVVDGATDSVVANANAQPVSPL